MSLYKYSQSYINKQLFDLPKEQWGSKRLELDLAALLIGSTSCHNAERLASQTCACNDPLSIALAMRDAAERYLNTLGKKVG